MAGPLFCLADIEDLPAFQVDKEVRWLLPQVAHARCLIVEGVAGRHRSHLSRLLLHLSRPVPHLPIHMSCALLAQLPPGDLLSLYLAQKLVGDVPKASRPHLKACMGALEPAEDRIASVHTFSELRALFGCLGGSRA